MAPLQVFSGSGGVWLQFAHIDELPAMFGRTPDGAEQLLIFRIHAPYVYLSGQWQALQFKAGHRVAQAIRVSPYKVIDDTFVEASAQKKQPSLVPSRTSGAPADKVAMPPRTGASQAQSASLSASADYAVGPEDGNVRRALSRWARIAGWTFEAEHWTVAADIPITARANLGADFPQAVAALLASTDMADLPVQPCFYQNRVLRVIAHAQRCDPRGHQPTVMLPADLATDYLRPGTRV